MPRWEPDPGLGECDPLFAVVRKREVFAVEHRVHEIRDLGLILAELGGVENELDEREGLVHGVREQLLHPLSGEPRPLLNILVMAY